MFLPSRKKSLLILALGIGTKFIFAQAVSTFITASDYCAFLNNAAKADTGFLYDQATGTDPDTGCITRLGVPGNYFYQVIAGRENFSVPYLTELNAARYNAINATENDLAANLKSNRIYFSVVDTASSPQTLMFKLPIAASVAEDTLLEEVIIDAGLVLVGLAVERTSRAPDILSEEKPVDLENIDISLRPPTRRENSFYLADSEEERMQPPKDFLSSDTRRSCSTISTAELSSRDEEELRPFESTETIPSHAIAELMPSIRTRAMAESDKRLMTVGYRDHYGKVEKSYLGNVEEEYEMLQVRAFELKQTIQNITSCMEFTRHEKINAFLERNKSDNRATLTLSSWLPWRNKVHLTDEYRMTPKEHELQLRYQNLAETKRKYEIELATVQKELSKNVIAKEDALKELSKMHSKIETALQAKNEMLIKMATKERELNLSHLQEEFLKRYEEEYSKLTDQFKDSLSFSF